MKQKDEWINKARTHKEERPIERRAHKRQGNTPRSVLISNSPTHHHRLPPQRRLDRGKQTRPTRDVSTGYHRRVLTLQLELFVLLTAAGLWTSQLFNSYITHISKHTPIYEALVIVYDVLIVPWLLTAWYGIRYENRTLTISFISVACIFILASSSMFISPIYRWAFYAWPCLGCFITASLILLIATVVLGSVCLRNFGKGLAEYLYASSNLSSSNFTRGVFERDVERDGSGGDEEGKKQRKEKEEEEFESRLGREEQGRGEGEGGEDFTMRYLPTIR
ncbi:hypothetical protein GGU10DRAFT_391346 [Lentinula aff. detonsa]|uniref:Uncharacterized protein n=1 Tax=Lentinula aff. detonsa TaxID=2804958 RepID=A0AA38KWB1_9AGAR|nr:hypothetical protein GGU10DRAFT_391346 [Lentinula aff. detonsa]